MDEISGKVLFISCIKLSRTNFETFDLQKEFGKTYNKTEIAMRFKLYTIANAAINANNVLYAQNLSPYLEALNQFSDNTQQENAQMNGAVDALVEQPLPANSP